MNKLAIILLASLLISPTEAFSKGKIQDEDVKSEAELISAGSDKTHLPNAQKIYVQANGINDTLHNAIANGAIGGGGSGTGINILKDPGFEAAGTSPEWTNTGGTFTHVTSGPNLLVGIGSATFQASATSQSVQGSLHTIPNGLLGQACAASLMYKGGDANLTFEVVDGSSAVVASKVLSASSSPLVVNLPFLCPSSGSLRWKVVSTASSAVIALDQAFLGQNSLIQVSQSGIFGSVIYDTACAWGMSANSSFQQMTDGGACTSVVHGGLSNPTPTTLGFTLANAPSGDYDISVRGTIYASSSGHQNTACAFNAYDTTLAVAAPAVLVGTIPTTSGNPEAIVPMMNFHLSYAQAGSHVIEIHGASHDGYEACNVTSADGAVGAEIVVTYHPGAAQIATQATGQAATWSGWLTTAASGWTTTSTSYPAAMTATGATTLNELSNVNFGSVVAASSNAPGVTFNALAGHTYDVSFSSDSHNPGVGNFIHLGLTTGSDDYGAIFNGVHTPAPTTLEGQIKASATGPMTVSVQAAVDTGTGYLADQGNRINIKINDITQPGPTLVLPGNVSTPSSGQEHIVRAHVSVAIGGPYTFQDGSPGVSIISASTGVFTANLTGGSTFSGNPTCTCTAADGSLPNHFQCTLVSTGNNAESFALRSDTSGDGVEGADVHFICIGPK